MPRRGDGRSTDAVRRTPVRPEQEACESRPGNGRRLSEADCGRSSEKKRRYCAEREGRRKKRAASWAGPWNLKKRKKKKERRGNGLTGPVEKRKKKG